ncbi:MAG: hypothetical protein ACFCD0_04555 [Gemmataceae bacterium]
MFRVRWILSLCLVSVLYFVFWGTMNAGGPPPDGEWKSNATLKNPAILTRTGLGAVQGVSIYRGKIYIYGDRYDVDPRVGVIREFDKDLEPTGKVITLTKNEKPLLLHPTGLTWDDKWGCFVGDTVDQKAKIYQLDWDRALKDGNLDNAVRAVILDDAAVNGCRPLFVKVGTRTFLATADYGDKTPHVRLYDPAELLKAKLSTAKGVLVHKIECGPFNQNLAWDANKGQLICVQNVIAGRGWQLDVIDLGKAIKERNVSARGVRVRKITLPPHSELEGWRDLGDGHSIFVTAHKQDNVIKGRIVRTMLRTSPKGTLGFRLPGM